MEKDKNLVLENKWKQNNQKNLDGMTYHNIYGQFILDQFNKEWDKRGAHTTGWTGKSLKFYKAKMFRLVMMKCYNWLLRNEESFLQDVVDDEMF